MSLMLHGIADNGMVCNWFIPYKNELSKWENDPLFTYATGSISRQHTITDILGTVIVGLVVRTGSVDEWNIRGGNGVNIVPEGYVTGTRFYTNDGYSWAFDVEGSQPIIYLYYPDSYAVDPITLSVTLNTSTSGLNYVPYGFGLYVDKNGETVDFGSIAYGVIGTGADNFKVNAVSFDNRHSASSSRGNYGIQGYVDKENVLNWFNAISPVDPLAGGGDSTIGGGTGTFDGTSGDFVDSNVPWVSVTDTGFVTLFNPTLSQLKALANYMWSTDFIDNFKKLFADPMDAILSLNLIPLPIPDGAVKTVTVGNVDTGVSMVTVAQGGDRLRLNCGTIKIEPYWGNALDYAPFTKVHLYLPFIGYRQLDTDEIMGKSITVTYDVDILTGSCVAKVYSYTTDNRYYLAYQYEGNCARSIPVTGSNWTQLLTTAIRSVSTVGTVGGAVAGSVSAGTLVEGLTNTASNVMGSKPTVSHSGNSTGTGGHLSYASPYIVIEFPNQSLPANYNMFEGYPSNISEVLGSLTGYTAIESIHLEGINATDTELAEIESLLKNGVIL